MGHTDLEFPRWFYCFDGYRGIAYKAEDLPPGWRDNPCASFPEMAQGWKWQISHAEGLHGGPFAPDTTEHRYMRYLPLEVLVYTAEPRVVNGVQRDYFEVWRGGSSQVERLIASGLVHRLPPSAQIVILEKTGRCFLDKDACAAAARRYETRDLTGFARDAPTTQDPTPTPAPEGAPRRRVGRPSGGDLDLLTLEDLREMLKDGWREASGRCSGKKRPSFEDVTKCVGHSRRRLSEALKKHHHTWDTIRPFLVD